MAELGKLGWAGANGNARELELMTDEYLLYALLIHNAPGPPAHFIAPPHA